ncbi:APC family permease [Siminovitchia sediminis]|uniref:APC family permease n=1 Tax=Siminovitchia sediminis TaxID=1274353 RepID=A0ABW4KCQ5_9BACI
MQQHSLNRTLTFWPLVFLGLAFMTMMIIFTTYGIASQVTQGMVPAAYVIVLVAMLFNVYSYGRMVKVFPSSGTSYAYAQKAIHPNAGFFVGWAIMMDYLLTPMLNYLVVGIYLSAAFPGVPAWIWIILFIALITTINVFGLKIAANVNFLLVAFQMLVVGIFAILCIKQIVGGMGTGTLFSSLPFYQSDASFSAVTAGAAILFLSFLGFDTITTFSEETINPEKTLPRAMFAVVLIGGGLFIALSYIIQMVYPDFMSFNDVDAAGFEVVAAVTGNLFTSIFLAGYIIACFASAMVSHAGISRFLYAMGRDGVLPKRFFGYVSPKRKVPLFNIVLVGLISLLALVLTMDLLLAFINFGVLVAFAFVNLSVISHYFIRNKRRNSVKEVVLFLILPLIGFSINAWLWTNLETSALILGGSWLLIGLIYLAFLTKMFRKPTPQMNLEDHDQSKAV